MKANGRESQTTECAQDVLDSQLLCEATKHAVTRHSLGFEGRDAWWLRKAGSHARLLTSPSSQTAPFWHSWPLALPR